MPLIVCPDCGKEFSDRAAACPNCGCPISAITGENPPTMQSNGNNLNSILLLADKAFSDNNYEEAYNSYNQAYLLEQENPHILLRLAMTTCARDASKAAVHGIPASSRQMIEKGFALLRSQAQDNSTFDGYVVNAAKDVSHIAGYLSSEAFSNMKNTLENMEKGRTAGQIIFDVVATPAETAHRNFYEDNRTNRRNEQIVNKANNDFEATERIEKDLKSCVFDAVLKAYGSDWKPSKEVLEKIKSYPQTKAEISAFNDFAGESPSVAKSGLCVGPEKVIVQLDKKENTIVELKKGKANLNSGRLFSPPKGTLTVTNYKLSFVGDKPKWSFERPLDGLLRVEKFYAGSGVDFSFLNGENVVVLFRGNADALIFLLNTELGL